MINSRVKRRVLIGILIAGTLAGTALAANASYKEIVPAADPVARQLQSLYDNVSATDIQIAPLAPLPNNHIILSADDRAKRLTEIEHELQRYAQEKASYRAAATDTEQAITTVEADFAHGILSAGDKDMLRKMFSDKQDAYREVLSNADKQSVQLNNEKQDLTDYHEPDQIEYGQARIDMANKLVTRTVFYNATQKRLLTEAEIAAQPAAAQIRAQMHDSEVIKRNEYPLIAGLITSVLVTVWIWRRLPQRRLPDMPGYLRQGT